jgi:ferredoxin
MPQDDPPKSSEGARVRVDPTKCKGYGVCSTLAPDIFLQDEWGFAYVQGGAVTAENRRIIEKAIRACPTKAIEILE